MSNPHHDAVGNNLNAFGWEIPNKSSLGQVIINFVQRLTLVVAEDDSEHNLTVVPGILGNQITGEKPKK